ncbi:MAG: hypothetical protein H6720_01675 [Sandaracinus sp.]|nr:hypothetical protein [Sandaracinus sp.]
MPAHASDFELLVQRRGFSGPHDDEAQRLAWGPFAPSSLQRVHRTELRNLHLTLTRGEP